MKHVWEQVLVEYDEEIAFSSFGTFLCCILDELFVEEKISAEERRVALKLIVDEGMRIKPDYVSSDPIWAQGSPERRDFILKMIKESV